MFRPVAAAAVAMVALSACADTGTEPTFVERGTVTAAAVWDYKVTGGGHLTAGSIDIWMQVAITDSQTEQGRVSGQVQYEASNGNKFHVAIDAFVATPAQGLYEACGVMTLQEGTFGSTGARVGLAIRDVDGGPDRMRIGLEGSLPCDGAEASFPAVMVDGDFRVKDDT